MAIIISAGKTLSQMVVTKVIKIQQDGSTTPPTSKRPVSGQLQPRGTN